MDTINETTFLDLGIPANERQAEHAGDMAAAPWTLGEGESGMAPANHLKKAYTKVHPLPRVRP